MGQNLTGNLTPMSALHGESLQRIEPGIRDVVVTIRDWVGCRKVASVWSCEGAHEHQNDKVGNKPFVVVVAAGLNQIHELVGFLASKYSGSLRYAKADLEQARRWFGPFVGFDINAAGAVIFDSPPTSGERKVWWNVEKVGSPTPWGVQVYRLSVEAQ